MRLCYKLLDDSIVDRLDSFYNKNNNFIEVNPGNVVMPRIYRDIGDQILNFEVRQDDIWMISYPRTGKTTNILCYSEFKKLYLLNFFKS